MTQDLKTEIAEAISKLPFAEGMISDNCTEAALQAIHDAGYVVMPVNPTDEMVAAVERANKAAWPRELRFESKYRAMISAIQASQPKTEEG